MRLNSNDKYLLRKFAFEFIKRKSEAYQTAIKEQDKAYQIMSDFLISGIPDNEFDILLKYQTIHHRKLSLDEWNKLLGMQRYLTFYNKQYSIDLTKVLNIEPEAKHVIPESHFKLPQDIDLAVGSRIKNVNSIQRKLNTEVEPFLLLIKQANTDKQIYEIWPEAAEVKLGIKTKLPKKTISNYDLEKLNKIRKG